MPDPVAADDDAAMKTAMSDPGFVPSRFTEATVRDAMTPGVISCAPETPLRSVARLMASHGVHSVVVFAPAGEWGIVSDLDLIAASSVIDRRTAGGTSVSPLVTVTPEETLERAAQLMSEHETSHLLVAEPNAERPVGVISTLDLARTLAVEPGTLDAGPGA
jgi:CBS domain-containing protein